MSHVLDSMRALLTARGKEIEQWFDDQFTTTPPFIYTSVDVRHSGAKLVPVDTNLFPAGFNNLTPPSRDKAVEAMKKVVTAGQRVLLLPEEHTRNLKYLDALVALRDIIRQAGAEVVIGTLDATQQGPLELVSASGEALVQYPLKKDGAKLITSEGFVADAIVLNNDLTTGIPALLRNIQQPMLPPPAMGWFQRRKSEHFRSYQQVLDQFCQSFGFPAWRLSADYTTCGEVDFKEMTGIECVATNVEKLIHRLREKYKEHNLGSDPYVFIKSDSGTYGMGIMTARSGEEVVEMNRKNRKKMQSLKGGASNTEVIIQEGIPTVDRIEGQTAEPMLYLVHGIPVGGAYRVHGDKDHEQNLNSVGMHFVPLCSEGQPKGTGPENCDFTILGMMGRLAALAAVREQYAEMSDTAAA